MSYAIEIKSLGKSYNIISRRASYVNFRDKLYKFLTFNFKKFNIEKNFWALKNFNLKIKKGEVIGIIGHNGAGKSTLLKLLSQITPPTEGSIVCNGRVASLLEVGAGFHPELTGAENIFFSGAILGMTKIEIEKKFDEIVEFSGVKRFLNTPVKFYSSGMIVRLAFSVAISLESEILLIDEVLTVGDMEFQKKSLKKMNQITNDSNRTIIFVSHDLSAVKRICNRCVLLEKGQIKKTGTTSEVIADYYRKSDDHLYSEKSLTEAINNLPDDLDLEIIDIQILQNEESIKGLVSNEGLLNVRVKYNLKKDIIGFRLFVDIYDNKEDLLFRSFHKSGDRFEICRKGYYNSVVKIPCDIFGPTEYEICLQSVILDIRAIIPKRALKFRFRVEDSNNQVQLLSKNNFEGKLVIPIEWETKKIKKN